MFRLHSHSPAGSVPRKSGDSAYQATSAPSYPAWKLEVQTVKTARGSSSSTRINPGSPGESWPDHKSTEFVWSHRRQMPLDPSGAVRKLCKDASYV
jgi:hypothetical protein